MDASPQVPDSHERMLTGLTDPFSPEAARAQYPDQGAGATLTFQQRFTATLTANAANEGALAVNPKINFPILQAATAASASCTWAANCTGNAATNLVNTFAKSYRPTSCGVRLSALQSATTASGYLVICKGGPPTVGQVTTFNPSSFSHWDTHSVVAGAEWHAVLHPRSSNAYDFKDPTLTNVNQFDDTWETLYLYTNGSAVGGVVILDIFINYEYTAVEDSPIAQLAVPQPILNVPMQTAVNTVQSSHPPSHKGPSSVIKNFIKKEGKKALLKHVLPFATKKATQLLL
jgi:hypothetical protein